MSFFKILFLFVCFPKAIPAFSRWEAEQIVLSGRTFVVLISVEVGCLAQQFAIFLLFLLFLIPSTAHNPLLLPFIFPPCPFPFFRSLSWKIIAARWVCLFVCLIIIITIIILRPGAFSSRGIFHQRRKRHHIYCEKKNLYMMSFPPSCPN